MIKVNCDVKCRECKKWSKSQFGFGDIESFTTTTLLGNKQSCLHCGKLVDIDKDNIKFTFRDTETGRVMIHEGQDALDKLEELQ